MELEMKIINMRYNTEKMVVGNVIYQSYSYIAKAMNMSRREVTDVCIGFELLRLIEHDIPPKMSKMMMIRKKKATKLLVE